MFSFIILLILAYFTVYLAVMYMNSAIMLLLYAEIVYFFVSVITLIYRRLTVKGSVDVPIGISEIGKENLVKIGIKNRSIFAMNRVKAQMVIKDTMSGKKQKKWMKVSQVGNGDNWYAHSVSFQGAGNYEIQLQKLKIYDLTGLMYGIKKVKKSKQIMVMPNIHDVPVKLTLATKNFYGEADVYDENKPGHDNSELFQVREYQKGDRLQHVHWKLTAKQDDLMVKEQSMPKSCPVVLVLNYARTGKKIKRKDIMSYMEAAVSISFSIMDAGCAHYVVWYDTGKKDIVRLRVDDEESLFYFIGRFMKVTLDDNPKEDLVERYKEKYRMEPYVWLVGMDEHLNITRNGELIAKLSSDNLEETLGSVEMLL